MPPGWLSSFRRGREKGGTLGSFLAEILEPGEEEPVERPRIRCDDELKAQLQRFQTVLSRDGALNWLEFLAAIGPLLDHHTERLGELAGPSRSSASKVDGGRPLASTQSERHRDRDPAARKVAKFSSTKDNRQPQTPAGPSRHPPTPASGTSPTASVTAGGHLFASDRHRRASDTTTEGPPTPAYHTIPSPSPLGRNHHAMSSRPSADSMASILPGGATVTPNTMDLRIMPQTIPSPSPSSSGRVLSGPRTNINVPQHAMQLAESVPQGMSGGIARVAGAAMRFVDKMLLHRCDKVDALCKAVVKRVQDVGSDRARPAPSTSAATSASPSQPLLQPHGLIMSSNEDDDHDDDDDDLMLALVDNPIETQATTSTPSAAASVPAHGSLPAAVGPSTAISIDEDSTPVIDEADVMGLEEQQEEQRQEHQEQLVPQVLSASLIAPTAVSSSLVNGLYEILEARPPPPAPRPAQPAAAPAPVLAPAPESMPPVLAPAAAPMAPVMQLMPTPTPPPPPPAVHMVAPGAASPHPPAPASPSVMIIPTPDSQGPPPASAAAAAAATQYPVSPSPSSSIVPPPPGTSYTTHTPAPSSPVMCMSSTSTGAPAIPAQHALEMETKTLKKKVSKKPAPVTVPAPATAPAVTPAATVSPISAVLHEPVQVTAEAPKRRGRQRTLMAVLEQDAEVVGGAEGDEYEGVFGAAVEEREKDDKAAEVVPAAVGYHNDGISYPDALSAIIKDNADESIEPPPMGFAARPPDSVLAAFAAQPSGVLPPGASTANMSGAGFNSSALASTFSNMASSASSSVFQWLDPDLIAVLADAAPGASPPPPPLSLTHIPSLPPIPSPASTNGNYQPTHHIPSALQLAQKVLLVTDEDTLTTGGGGGGGGGGMIDSTAQRTTSGLPTLYSIGPDGKTAPVPTHSECTVSVTVSLDVDVVSPANDTSTNDASINDASTAPISHTPPHMTTQPPGPDLKVLPSPRPTRSPFLAAIQQGNAPHLSRTKPSIITSSDTFEVLWPPSAATAMGLDGRGPSITSGLGSGTGTSNISSEVLMQPLSSGAQAGLSHGQTGGASFTATDGVDGVMISATADNRTMAQGSAVDLSNQEPSYWAVDPNDVTLIRRLGSGSYGEVWLASYHFVDVAVKIVPWRWSSAASISRHCLPSAAHDVQQHQQQQQQQEDQDAFAAELARFRQEVDFQRRLSLHPNIVPFIGACEPTIDTSGPLPGSNSNGRAMSGLGPAPQAVSGQPPPRDQLAIVMGYCKLGDVYNMIRKARSVRRLVRSQRRAEASARSLSQASVLYHNWERRLEVAAGAAAGLYHMHHQGVVHRDLTSYNVLLDSGFSAKVCDFNLSRVVPGGTCRLLANSGTLNSPLWQPPEMLRGDKSYDGKSLDVFSFGIILSEIITLWVPYTSGSEEESLAIMSDFRSIWPLILKITSGSRPHLPTSLSELDPPLPHSLTGAQAEEVFTRLIKITQACWHPSSELRPSMKEVAAELRSLVLMLRNARIDHTGASAYQQQQLERTNSNAQRQRSLQAQNNNWGTGAHHGMF